MIDLKILNVFFLSTVFSQSTSDVQLIVVQDVVINKIMIAQSFFIVHLPTCQMLLHLRYDTMLQLKI